MLERVEKVVSKLSRKDREALLHDLDHCLLMANKFEETGKTEYFVRMKTACKTFLEKLEELEAKA